MRLGVGLWNLLSVEIDVIPFLRVLPTHLAVSNVFLEFPLRHGSTISRYHARHSPFSLDYAASIFPSKLLVNNPQYLLPVLHLVKARGHLQEVNSAQGLDFHVYQVLLDVLRNIVNYQYDVAVLKGSLSKFDFSSVYILLASCSVVIRSFFTW